MSIPARYPAHVYDLMHRDLAGDIPFFVRLAREAGGPALELACGTGRILAPVAAAGVKVTGLDLDPGMLATARRRIRGLAPAARKRARLERADMRDFALRERFALAFCGFNSFLHLLTPEDQERCLLRVREHLVPGGRFVLAVFDPLHDKLSERGHDAPLFAAPVSLHSEIEDPATGETLLVTTARRTLDHVDQVLRELWCFERFDRGGRSLGRTIWPLTLRWTFPQELRYLFRLTGFEVESLHGGYDGEEFRHGSLQVWVTRRAARTGDRRGKR